MYVPSWLQVGDFTLSLISNFTRFEKIYNNNAKAGDTMIVLTVNNYANRDSIFSSNVSSQYTIFYREDSNKPYIIYIRNE